MEERQEDSGEAIEVKQNKREILKVERRVHEHERDSEDPETVLNSDELLGQTGNLPESNGEIGVDIGGHILKEI